MKDNNEKATRLFRFSIALALAATGFYVFSCCISSTAMAADGNTIKQQVSSPDKQKSMAPEAVTDSTKKVDAPALENKGTQAPVPKKPVTQSPEKTMKPIEKSVDKRPVSMDSKQSPSPEEKQQFLSRQVYFAYNSSELDEEAQALVREQATWLVANPGVSIEIIGCCDQSGPKDYNMALGEKRANAVKAFLESLGIEPQRLTEVSHGEKSPLRSTTNQDAARVNRRVEFKIQPAA